VLRKEKREKVGTFVRGRRKDPSSLTLTRIFDQEAREFHELGECFNEWGEGLEEYIENPDPDVIGNPDQLRAYNEKVRQIRRARDLMYGAELAIREIYGQSMLLEKIRGEVRANPAHIDLAYERQNIARKNIEYQMGLIYRAIDEVTSLAGSSGEYLSKRVREPIRNLERMTHDIKEKLAPQDKHYGRFNPIRLLPRRTKRQKWADKHVKPSYTVTLLFLAAVAGAVLGNQGMSITGNVISTESRVGSFILLILAIAVIILVLIGYEKKKILKKKQMSNPKPKKKRA